MTEVRAAHAGDTSAIAAIDPHTPGRLAEIQALVREQASLVAVEDGEIVGRRARAPLPRGWQRIRSHDGGSNVPFRPLRSGLRHLDPGYAWAEVWDNYNSHGFGCHPAAGADPVTAPAAVADDAQDVVMHAIGGAWPVCVAHPLGTHAPQRDGAAGLGQRIAVDNSRMRVCNPEISDLWRHFTQPRRP
jgi:hypothetical protein